MGAFVRGMDRNGPVNFPEILLGKPLRVMQLPRPCHPAGDFSERYFTHMAVALRLNRQGTKDRPYYKIVAVDSRKRRDGRYIEQVGTYDPLKEGVNYTIDLEKADKWIGVGAQVSETVNSIVRKARTAASKVEA